METEVESQLFPEPCLLRLVILSGEESWTGLFLSLDVPTQLRSSPLFFQNSGLIPRELMALCGLSCLSHDFLKFLSCLFSPQWSLGAHHHFLFKPVRPGTKPVLYSDKSCVYGAAQKGGVKTLIKVITPGRWELLMAQGYSALSHPLPPLPPQLWCSSPLT